MNSLNPLLYLEKKNEPFHWKHELNTGPKYLYILMTLRDLSRSCEKSYHGHAVAKHPEQCHFFIFWLQLLRSLSRRMHVPPQELTLTKYLYFMTSHPLVETSVALEAKFEGHLSTPAYTRRDLARCKNNHAASLRMIQWSPFDCFVRMLSTAALCNAGDIFTQWKSSPGTLVLFACTICASEHSRPPPERPQRAQKSHVRSQETARSLPSHCKVLYCKARQWPWRRFERLKWHAVYGVI